MGEWEYIYQMSVKVCQTNFFLMYLFQELKKLQGQITAEKEVLYGTKVSPSKTQNAKKTPRSGSAACRRISLGCQTPKSDSKPYQSQLSFTKRTEKAHQNDRLNNLDDDVSCLSSGS